MDLEKKVDVDELATSESPEEFLLRPYSEKLKHKKEWAIAYLTFWAATAFPVFYN